MGFVRLGEEADIIFLNIINRLIFVWR